MWHVEQFTSAGCWVPGAASVLARGACSAELAAAFHSLVEILLGGGQGGGDPELVVDGSELGRRGDEAFGVVLQRSRNQPGTYEQ